MGGGWIQAEGKPRAPSVVHLRIGMGRGKKEGRYIPPPNGLNLLNLKMIRQAHLGPLSKSLLSLFFILTNTKCA